MRKRIVNLICRIFRLKMPYWVENIITPFPLYVKDSSVLALKINNIDYWITTIEGNSWVIGITTAKR